MTRRAAALALVLAVACEGPVEAPAPVPFVTPAPTPRATSDLLFLSGPRTLQVFALSMPDGALSLAIDGWTNASLAAIDAAGRLAYAPVNALEGNDTRTVIEKIDLRTGGRADRFDAGVVPGRPQSRAELARVIIEPSGETMLLLRHFQRDTERIGQIDAYDTRTGGHLGRRSSSVLGTFVVGDVSAIDRERFLLTLRTFDGARADETWSIVDRTLAPVRSYAIRDAFAFRADEKGLWPHRCRRDIRAAPGGRWVAVCETPFARTVEVVDATSVEPIATIPLPVAEQAGTTVGWHLAEDGRVTILTNQAELFRVDIERRRLSERRGIGTGAFDRSRWASAFRAFFSPDGRFAYMQSPPGSRGQGVGVVDLVTGKVVAVALDGEAVTSAELSTDGLRLYAVVDLQASDRPAAVAVVDARTAQPLARFAAPFSGGASIVTLLPKE